MEISKMNIAYITDNKNSSTISSLEGYFEEITTVNSYSFEDFAALGKKFDAIIISMGLDRIIIEIFVKKIRTSDKLFIVPIFFEENGTFLFIETVITVDKIKERIKNIETLNKEIEHHNYNGWENRLLSYFYTRPDLTITPKIDKHHEMFYYYPIVEQFYDGHEDYSFWLEDMSNQNIFSKVKLIDRLFCCPYCFSALMKFSEHCPNCGSINVKQEKFVHCFTCGHVAPESKFMKDDRLVCPSCKSKLKLIGEDYDRPLENGVCLDCGDYHIEGKLKVSCMTCNKNFSAEDLSKKFIYEYKLTDHGRNQIKFGTANSVDMITNELNYITLNYFIFTLNWYIQMQKRYTDSYFSLLALQIVMDTESSTYDLIIEFSKLLRNTFRNTDFCSKVDTNTFIFLFAKADLIGANVIKSRIDSFLTSIKLTRGKFDIRTEYFSSTQENIAEENGQQLIGKLTNKL